MLSRNLFKEFYTSVIELAIPDWVYNGSTEDIDLSPEVSELADWRIESGTGVYLWNSWFSFLRETFTWSIESGRSYHYSYDTSFILFFKYPNYLLKSTVSNDSYIFYIYFY